LPCYNLLLSTRCLLQQEPAQLVDATRPERIVLLVWVESRRTTISLSDGYDATLVFAMAHPVDTNWR
jgi:hypothetical protein